LVNDGFDNRALVSQQSAFGGLRLCSREFHSLGPKFDSTKSIILSSFASRQSSCLHRVTTDFYFHQTCLILEAVVMQAGSPRHCRENYEITIQ
jgi:hypothetical protein